MSKLTIDQYPSIGSWLVLEYSPEIDDLSFAQQVISLALEMKSTYRIELFPLNPLIDSRHVYIEVIGFTYRNRRLNQRNWFDELQREYPSLRNTDRRYFEFRPGGIVEMNFFDNAQVLSRLTSDQADFIDELDAPIASYRRLWDRFQMYVSREEKPDENDESYEDDENDESYEDEIKTDGTSSSGSDNYLVDLILSDGASDVLGAGLVLTKGPITQTLDRWLIYEKDTYQRLEVKIITGSEIIEWNRHHVIVAGPIQSSIYDISAPL